MHKVREDAFSSSYRRRKLYIIRVSYRLHVCNEKLLNKEYPKKYKEHPGLEERKGLKGRRYPAEPVTHPVA